MKSTPVCLPAILAVLAALLAGCLAAPMPTFTPTVTPAPNSGDWRNTDPRCQNVYAGGQYYRRMEDALQSSLSHPSDSLAIQSSIEAFEQVLQLKPNSYNASYQGKLEIVARQALSLTKQLQKDPLIATTKEFEQEVKTLRERMQDASTAIDDIMYTGCQE